MISAARLARVSIAASLLACAACGARSPASTPGRSAAAATASLVDVHVLAFNDFHGALEPVDGANGRVQATDAGGVEFFASHIKRLKTAHPNSVVVSAGDNIGASTLLSAMFHDEPTIEALNKAGLQVSTVGNHEFDEGWPELYRMQTGGCHPVDGCQDKTPFGGATFEFLSANVVVDPARVDAQDAARSGWRPHAGGPQTLFPAFTVRDVDGLKVGFIGLVLQGAPQIIAPAGIRGLTFRREVDAANEAAAALVRQGVRAIVVLIHEGGTPASDDSNTCGVTGPIVDIVNGLSSDIDVVVSGHTHRAYICTIGMKLVTSALSLGRVVTDIDLLIDPRTGEVVRKSARNEIVTRDVPKAADETAIIEHYRPYYAALGTRQVGTIASELVRTPNAAGESVLGDIVADAMLEGARAAGDAVAAFWNPGGIRADLVGQAGAASGPRIITFAQAFDVLPFGNRLVVRTITGAAILRILEQQFDNPNPGAARVLSPSGGFSYAYDRSRPAGQRVDAASVRIGGRPLDPAGRYRIALSDFLWAGGDSLAAAQESSDALDIGVDVELFVDYLAKHSPVGLVPVNRITRK
jgi:5'-nucleotidase